MCAWCQCEIHCYMYKSCFPFLNWFYLIYRSPGSPRCISCKYGAYCKWELFETYTDCSSLTGYMLDHFVDFMSITLIFNNKINCTQMLFFLLKCVFQLLSCLLLIHVDLFFYSLLEEGYYILDLSAFCFAYCVYFINISSFFSEKRQNKNLFLRRMLSVNIYFTGYSTYMVLYFMTTKHCSRINLVNTPNYK